MKEIVDTDGNIIIFNANDDKLYLKLRQRNEKRFIGWYEQETSTFHTKRTELHVFKSFNGFGFNYNLIKNAKFKFVAVHYEGDIYFITTEDIKKGEVLSYKKEGYELQIFAKLDSFYKFDKALQELAFTKAFEKGLENPEEPKPEEGINGEEKND